jgi:hypothetical protein
MSLKDIRSRHSRLLILSQDLGSVDGAAIRTRICVHSRSGFSQIKNRDTVTEVVYR